MFPGQSVPVLWGSGKGPASRFFRWMWPVREADSCPVGTAALYSDNIPGHFVVPLDWTVFVCCSWSFPKSSMAFVGCFQHCSLIRTRMIPHYQYTNITVGSMPWKVIAVPVTTSIVYKDFLLLNTKRDILTALFNAYATKLFCFCLCVYTKCSEAMYRYISID